MPPSAAAALCRRRPRLALRLTCAALGASQATTTEMGYEEGEGEGEGEEEEEEEEYSEASPPTAVSDGKRKYKMGDAALRLDDIPTTYLKINLIPIL